MKKPHPQKPAGFLCRNKPVLDLLPKLTGMETFLYPAGRCRNMMLKDKIPRSYLRWKQALLGVSERRQVHLGSSIALVGAAITCPSTAGMQLPYGETIWDCWTCCRRGPHPMSHGTANLPFGAPGGRPALNRSKSSLNMPGSRLQDRPACVPGWSCWRRTRM